MNSFIDSKFAVKSVSVHNFLNLDASLGRSRLFKLEILELKIFINKTNINYNIP